MKFSIITPTKKIDEYTRMAIDSVRSQTTNSKYEHIIIIDDQNEGPPENNVYENYSLKYMRSKRILGPSSSRNEGISEAIGEIICLLDSDDLWTNDYWRNLKRFLIKRKILMQFQ